MTRSWPLRYRWRQISARPVFLLQIGEMWSSRWVAFAVSSVAAPRESPWEPRAAPSRSQLADRITQDRGGRVKTTRQGDRRIGIINCTATESPGRDEAMSFSVARSAKVNFEMPAVVDAAIDPELSIRTRRATCSPEPLMPSRGRPGPGSAGR